MFLELWARSSEDRSALAFVSTILYYEKHVYNGGNGNRGLVANLKFTNISNKDTNNDNREASVVLGNFRTSSEIGALHRFGFVENLDKSASPGITSKWIPSPFTAVGSEGKNPPLNLEITFNEIRDPKPVLAFIGEALTKSKATIQEELELALIKQKRDEADRNAANARAEALDAYATNLALADEKAVAYCAAGGNRRSKAAQFLAAQLKANVAAESAEVPLPFPIVVKVNNEGPDSQFCPSW